MSELFDCLTVHTTIFVTHLPWSCHVLAHVEVETGKNVCCVPSSFFARLQNTFFKNTFYSRDRQAVLCDKYMFRPPNIALHLLYMRQKLSFIHEALLTWDTFDCASIWDRLHCPYSSICKKCCTRACLCVVRVHTLMCESCFVSVR